MNDNKETILRPEAHVEETFDIHNYEICYDMMFQEGDGENVNEKSSEQTRWTYDEETGTWRGVNANTQEEFSRVNDEMFLFMLANQQNPITLYL